MQIPVPEGTTAKQVDVVIKPGHLVVKLKGQSTPIIDGDLAEKIKVSDSFWTVENKKFISISFEKAYEAIWKTVIVGDKEIDPKTVDNSKKVEEFDLET
jgi:regulatory protein YycH of two-component signal transduction system YycFG